MRAYLLITICTLALNSASESSFGQAGQLDPSFASDGILNPGIGDWSNGKAIAIQPDGKIVVCGIREESGTRSIAVVRSLLDGTSDNSFSGDGLQVIPCGDYGEVNDLTLQPDGMILLTGHTGIFGEQRMVVMRLQSVGPLDISFGVAGKAYIELSGSQGYGESLALADDGSIYVGGSQENDSSVVVRLLSNGEVDSTFGGDGVVALPITPQELHLINGDRLLVAGTGNSAMRLFESGSVDSTYAVDGVFQGSGNAYGSCLDQQGRLVTAGYDLLARTVVGRVDTSGFPDLSFGVNGYVREQYPGVTLRYFNDCVVQPDGRIVAVGRSGTGDTASAIVHRYDASGTPDASLGSNGVVHTIYTPGATSSLAKRCTLQADGKLVTIGTWANGNDDDYNMSLARYLMGGPIGIAESDPRLGKHECVWSEEGLCLTTEVGWSLEVEVFDAQGRSVLLERPMANTAQYIWPIPDLPSGVYLVRFASTRETCRFMVNK